MKSGAASFSCDDSVFKDNQLPYTIDPSTATVSDPAGGMYYADSWYGYIPDTGMWGQGWDFPTVPFNTAGVIPSNGLLVSASCSLNTVSLTASPWWTTGSAACGTTSLDPDLTPVFSNSGTTQVKIWIDTDTECCTNPYMYAATVDSVTLTVTYSTISLTSPANNATGLSTTPTLSFAGGDGAAVNYYTLFLGTSNPPPAWSQVGVPGSIGPLGPLSPGTTYYWYVQALTRFGTAATPIWQFTTQAVQAVASPTFSPGGGTYASAQSVTIGTATSGATIRYTTNGATPSEASGTVYTGAIPVANSMTVKAIAYKSGYSDSAVVSAAYTITPVITGPSSLPGGTVGAAYPSTTVTATGGTGSYTWTAPGLPAGVSIGASTGVISGTPATNSGSPFSVVVTATDGNSVTASKSYSLTVNPPPPSFSMTVTPTSPTTITQGGSVTYAVVVTPANGFTGTVNLAAGQPQGVSPGFSPAVVTISGTGAVTSTLTVATSQSTPTGTISLTVTATGGGVTQTGTATLTVNPPPSFSMTVTATSPTTITQGGSVTHTVAVTPAYGFTGTVNLTASGQPQGVTAGFSLATVTISGTGAVTSTLTVATSASAATGTMTLTVTATGGGVTQTGAAILTVNPPPPSFTMTVTPTSPTTITAGGSVTYAVVVTPANGFTGTVNLAATGQPAGVSPSFSPAVVTISGTSAVASTLTVATSASAATGTMTLTVTATGGGVTQTGAATLTVNPAPSFTMTVTPTSPTTITAGGSATYAVRVTGVNGFSGVVGFQVTGQPDQATVTFSPLTVTGSGLGTMTVATSAGGGTGTFTLTVTLSEADVASLRDLTNQREQLIESLANQILNSVRTETAARLRTPGHIVAAGVRGQAGR